MRYRHLRQFRLLCPAAALLLTGIAPACAGSGSATPHTTTLKSSTGGTGLSRAGGNGGTGISTTANAPLGSLQSTMTPAHAVAPPRAGVRPQTDLNAAEKLTNLSSRSIVKQSSLYNKIVMMPGDPALVGPYVGKLAPANGGGASFKQTPGFTAGESNGEVLVKSGGIDNNTKPSASLSSYGVATASAPVTTDDDLSAFRVGYRPLDWIKAVFAILATAAVGVWLWQQAPKGARMTLPVPAH